MKKEYLTLAAFCLLLGLGSCNSHSGKSQNHFNAENTEDVDANHQAESAKPFATEMVTINKAADNKMDVHYKYTVDFPVEGPQQLVASVKETIFKTLGDSTANRFTKEQLEALGQQFVDRSIAEIKSFGEDARTMAYANEGRVEVVANTDRYLTYTIKDYLYTGGAHGASRDLFFTFRKKDGKLLTWDDIFPQSNLTHLKDIVKQAIVEQHYQGNAPDWGDIFKFDLPQQCPAFTIEGMTFNYASYEIDAYAAGMPKCILPYHVVKVLMTPEAQALID